MKAGPKAAPKGDPLPLYELPERGGARAVAFIERYCRVVKGGRGNPAGELMILRPWQRDFVEALFDPEPRPRQALLSVARKNGKSLLGAGVALYGLLGDGVESAEVLLASSDERTAAVIFRVARRMVELSPEMSGVCQIFQDRIYHPASDSILEPLPSRANNLQGRNPSLAIVDETHVTNSEVWDALALAGGTRERPLILGLSTEGADDPDSLLSRLVEHGRHGGDPGFAFMEFTAPVGCPLDDRSAWAAANPQLGDTLDPEHLATVLATTREPAFRRFHLNQRVNAAGAWLPPGAWDDLGTGHPVPGAAEVVVAVDGSYNSDATAIVIATVSPEPHFDLWRIWERPADAREWVVPVPEVLDAVRAACARFSVLESVWDPFRFALPMQQLEAERIPVVSFPWSPARVTPATVDLYQAVVGSKLTHSGNATLARHVGNAVVREDSKGIRLDKGHTRRHIDAAAALLMAHSRATWRATRKTRSRRVRSFR